jgi:hypothetical protein
MSDLSHVRFEARWEYKEGGGQDCNPYPAGSQERIEWALEMGRAQQEELTSIRSEMYVSQSH